MYLLRCFNMLNSDLQSIVLQYFNPWKELFTSKIINEHVFLKNVWNKKCDQTDDKIFRFIFKNFFAFQWYFDSSNKKHFIIPDDIESIKSQHYDCHDFTTYFVYLYDHDFKMRYFHFHYTPKNSCINGVLVFYIQNSHKFVWRVQNEPIKCSYLN